MLAFAARLGDAKTLFVGVQLEMSKIAQIASKGQNDFSHLSTDAVRVRLCENCLAMAVDMRLISTARLLHLDSEHDALVSELAQRLSGVGGAN